MAMGKARNAKRSSSSSGSCLSTVTMLAFIALCALGLWMLTSSSVVPPQSTVRTSKAFASSNPNSRIYNKPLRPRDPPAFDDTQGDLPDDAVIGDAEQREEVKISSQQEDKQLILDVRRDPETIATDEQVGKAESKTGEAIESYVVEERKESSEEDEGQQQKQVSEESNETVETQRSSSRESGETAQQTGEEETSAESKKESDEEQIREDHQQDTELESRENTQQNAQQETEIESKETQQQTHRDSEAESGENATQIVQENGNESEDSAQQIEQTQRLSENETHEYPDQTQQDSEIQSRENPQPKQQESEIESHEKSQSETGLGNQEQNKTQKQVSQAQIQEVTSDDTRKQQQRDFQEAEINEDQQYQQTPIESSPAESKESNQSVTKSSSNQQQIQQVTSAAAEDHNEENLGDSFPAQSGIPKESNESKASWSTQAAQSQNQKGRSIDGGSGTNELTWELCNVTAGADYIPCLDNEDAIRHLRSRRHFEHRERHCPQEGPTCLVPHPVGYKRSIEWPKSREKIWYHNVPHTKLAEVKGHQNWLKVTGEFLTFPGGGTQFIHGALHYIDFIQKSVPKIAWGKHTRVVLDVGCGVASFGGYLFERDVLTMSFAPKDEHEAQVQFALERGIPAISAVMGSQRLPFPGRVFDMVHCARCRVPWHAEGGALLLELNRVLRPGGYFVWSATPVYQKLPEDTEIWKAMSSLTRSMCWDLVTIKKDKLNGIGAAIYRKPVSNECYEQRRRNSPPMCKDDDDPNAAWYVPLQACMHRVPVHSVERGSQWPESWPLRVHKPPYWLKTSQKGIYGKPAPDDFATDYEHWKRIVTKSYMSGLGISWSNVRNVMDMRAVYGGFAAALKDLKVWVMNVVNIDSPDTLPIIYERGLFGIYHDWCESFSTYPRTYDLLHADHLFSRLKNRCTLLAVMAEVDRIVRPGGKLIIRDDPSVIGEVENILKSLHWEIHLTFAKGQDGMLSAQKTDWRPQAHTSSS